MSLVKRCCDRTLAEIGEYFGTKGYATVSWSCHTVESLMARKKSFRHRIEKIAAGINQTALSGGCDHDPEDFLPDAGNDRDGCVDAGLRVCVYP
jgi:hypothetical protein